MRRAYVPDGWTDPAGLDGDALTQWYLRSPADIEQERRAAAGRRYQNFFYGSDETDPTFGSYSASEPGAGSDSAARPPAVDSDAAWPDDGSGSVPPLQDETLPIYSATTPDLTLQPAAPPLDGPFLPPLTFNPIPAAARWSGVGAPAPAPSGPPGGLPAHPSAYGAGRPATVASAPATGQTISYGALRAPAPTDGELADLRRKQAAFGDVTRKIDLQNAWFAAPVLAASALPFLPEAAARWVIGEGAPEAGQAITNFVGRDRYLRAGENYATKAGRRAHAWLEDRLVTKPGWDYEPDVVRPNARPLKPDVGTPQRNPADLDQRYYLELKPNAPTGRAAAARAVKRYMDATNQKVRAIFYDPKDFM
jgi:hypothetical protein